MRRTLFVFKGAYPQLGFAEGEDIRMNFASDNWTGAARQVLDAVAAANANIYPAYGGDELTSAVEARFAEIFDRDVAVFFVATGGAANGLALSSLSPRYGMILCHEQAHVQMDECAGPEFFTGGAKLVSVPGSCGKVTPDAIAHTLSGYPERPPHGAPAATLSITQASECGTVYTADEVSALSACAHGAGMKVHMDGARFANAVAALGCAPADITWRAGVDVLSFGGTKNGCLAAEAVVFFDPSAVSDFAFLRKRAGHLISKSWFIAAQFDAYLGDGLWLRLAKRANDAAQRLSSGLAALDGVRVWYPTQVNEVFVSFPAGLDEHLRAAGAHFYPWVTPGDPANGTMNRLICSFLTTDAEIDAFIDLVRAQI